MAIDKSIQLLTEATEIISSEFAVASDIESVANTIINDETACGTFLDKISEGMNALDRANFMQYAMNSREEGKNLAFLQENTASTMSQFAVLDNLMLREIWMRLGAREAMTYKVLQQPAIQVAFLKQLMKDVEGNLVDVPTALRSDTLTYKTIEVEIDLSTEKEINVFEKSGIDNKHKNLTLNKFGEFIKFTCSTETNGGGTEVPDVKQVVKPGQEGHFTADVIFKNGGTTYSDTLMAFVDRMTGKVTVTSLNGKIKKAWFRCKVSTETNRFTKTIEHKMEKINIAVGDGDTINSTVPITYLQDMRALFKLDAVVELSDLLSKSFATIYDMEVYDALMDTIELPEQTISYDASNRVSDSTAMISRQMQNASLLDRVFRGIAIIDSRYNFNGDVDYYLLVNPIDNAIISGAIVPDYSGTAYKGGSIKHYTNGEAVASYGGSDVKVISSKNFTSGKALIVPKPVTDSEICFGYFDYSQTLLPMGSYRNEMNVLVPNIAMNKRKVIHSFRPDTTQLIDIKNNTLE